MVKEFSSSHDLALALPPSLPSPVCALMRACIHACVCVCVCACVGRRAVHAHYNNLVWGDWRFPPSQTSLSETFSMHISARVQNLA